MNKIKAFIFDMDGLILDSERIVFQCYKRAFEENNYKFTEEFFITLIGTNLKMTKEICLDTYGKDLPFDLLESRKDEIIKEIIKEQGIPMKTGVKELLDYLKGNNYKIALATSTYRDKAEELLELVKIKNKFNCIICGNDVINSKPDPEIFVKAAEKLKVKPEECVVLEDSKMGIIAGVRAGMKVINVPDMKKPDREMKDMVFNISENLLCVKEFLENNKNN